MPRRSTAVAVTCLLAASLVGCTPPPTAPPTPTSTAIFASEEEALAAATDVYQQYTAAFDKESAGGGGGTAVESIRPLVTEEYLTELLEPGMLEMNGWRTEGATTFDSVSLVEVTGMDRSAEVRLRLCRDVSKVRVLDAAGRDVTPTTRASRFPVEVLFVSSAPASPELLIAETGSWSGENFC